jgi:hypothetical protein
MPKNGWSIEPGHEARAQARARRRLAERLSVNFPDEPSQDASLSRREAFYEVLRAILTLILCLAVIAIVIQLAGCSKNVSFPNRGKILQEAKGVCHSYVTFDSYDGTVVKYHCRDGRKSLLLDVKR